MELKDNTILITGGTSGFGLAFAVRLAKLRNEVIITGRDRARLERVKRDLPGVHVVQSDVGDPAAIRDLYEEVVSRFPALNVLINNAGEMRKLNLVDPAVDQDDANREIAINLSGPIRMVQQFLPHLTTKKRAAILNVTSGIAFVPFPLAPIYSATKAGLRAYTRALRVQLKKTNIAVFELAAPAAKTPLNDKFAHDVDPRMLKDPGEVIDFALGCIAKDIFEILPGSSRAVKLMSRLAPELLLRSFVKMVEKAFASKLPGARLDHLGLPRQ